MIHLIDPRYTPPPLTAMLEGPRSNQRIVKAYEWLPARHLHSALLIAYREPNGLWRILKARWDTGKPDRCVRRKTLERMVMDTMAKVEGFR